jgi:hypothetical protein
MFNVDWSKYDHADHPRVRRIAKELENMIRPHLINGQIPTSGEMPADIAEKSMKLFNELDALIAHNKRGN